MALVKCPKCGQKISDKAEKCPNCGVDINEFLEEQEKIREQEEIRKREEAEQKLKEEQEKLASKIICPECKNYVDKDSVICPICAYPIKEELEKKNIKEIKREKIIKKTIKMLIIVVIVIASFKLIRDEITKKGQYEKADNYYNNNQFEQAEELYIKLDDYKDAKEKSKLAKAGKNLQELDELMSSKDYFTDEDISLCKSVLNETKTYSKLQELRNTVIDKIYDKAVKYNVPNHRLVENLETKYKLAQLVKNYKDISSIEELYIDYTSCSKAIRQLEEENYDAAYDECLKISDNNEDSVLFRDAYKKLYENCSLFIGNWKTDETYGPWFQISFGYSKEEYTAEKYGELYTPYLRLSIAERELMNEALTGKDTGYCYKNLVWGNGEISFEYHDSGSLEPYYSVRCYIENNEPKVFINSAECHLFEVRSGSSNSGGQEPYIGMSAYDAENNCAWGKPDKKNVTETQHGKREQWVYSGYGYLYIEDDKVVGLQK